MSKRKPQQKSAVLSPENYIRQRSRNLPIYECLISNTWRDEKMAHITIARKHVSGNITFCAYLLDIGCIGVRESSFVYNEPQDEYEAYIKEVENLGLTLEKVPYELVHNIIFASVEYAEEYGFEPNKNFRLITKYFLEEDTEDIPLIEIECGGKDGMPQYTDTGADSPARVNYILKQLEKTAGEGNYHYVIAPIDDDGEDFDDDEEDFDDDDEEDFDDGEEDFDDDDDLRGEVERLKKEEYYGLSLEELKGCFFSLFNEKTVEGLANLSTDEYLSLSAITEVLIEELTDDELITDYFSELSEDLTVNVVENTEMPNSLFQGISGVDGDTLENLFHGVFASMADKKNTKKALSELEAKTGDSPFLDYMKLICINSANKKKYNKVLEECYGKYPDYFLFKILWHEYLYAEKGIEESYEKFKSLLHDENLTITRFEHAEYIVRYAEKCYNIIDEFNFEKVVALEEFMVDDNRPTEFKTKILLGSMNLIKIYEMAKYLIDEQLAASESK